MTTDEAKHLWYSVDAKRNGCSLNKARTVDGQIVVYTCVTRDRDGAGYLWADKEYLGEMAEYIGGIAVQHWSNAQ